MCQNDTRSPGAGRRRRALRAAAGALAALTAVAGARAQTGPGVHPDWRHIGNSAINLSLAAPASGPAERVWYSADGSRLYVQTGSGKVFETNDFERWTPSGATSPAEPATSGTSAPEGERGLRVSATDPLRLYAYGGQVLRSDDGGASWVNLTAYERQSIIGSGMRDLAVSPASGDEIAVANEEGVWRSLDGGVTWSGLNDTLPNLPARRIAALPHGPAGIRLTTSAAETIEWAPGEKQAWKPVADAAALRDVAARKLASVTLGADVTAIATAGDYVYAGSSDGRLWVSSDRGRNWNSTLPAERGPVEAIYVDPQDPGLALAALGINPRGVTGHHVLRTVNAGRFWDDLTADLPEAPAYGVTADRAMGTVYVATARGVFLTRADLEAAGPATPWTPLAGLPAAPALDVRLDAGGNQLFVAVEGYGVYAALAPHRLGSLRLVNAADLSQRAAAPGSLLSVLGGRVTAADADGLRFPVLAASATETQIQVPFAARGSSLALALQTSAGSVRLAVLIESVSPAIFVDRDGTPLVLDADTGVLLDAMNTAHSNGRLQILVTGLGAVRPDWPSGMPAPLDNPPAVVAPVAAYLDRAPVEVTRAVLAPGYVGLYLVEVQLPALVNAGPAELYIGSQGRESNRVRIWIEP
jgi:uncharacterized protein (TIGR03437 family)